MTARKIINVKKENFLKLIFRPIKDNKFELRYKRIHTVLKNWILYPVLKLLYKILGKYAIRSLDDIPKEKHNNHQRMFYSTWEKSLKEVWTTMEFFVPGRGASEGSRWKSAEDCFERRQKHTWNHKLRMLMIKIWITEILEDTFDREWLNIFMLNLWHTMNEHYKGKVPKHYQYPKYIHNKANDPLYFHFIDETQTLWEEENNENKKSE